MEELKPGTRVLCKWKDNNFCNAYTDPAEVIQERQKPKPEYYVHYLPFNKRLDRWVDVREVRAMPAEGIPAPSSMVTRFHKRKREETNPAEHIEDPSNPELAQFEKDHEEATKVRNVDRVVFGRYEMQPWYYSPYLSNLMHIPTLYICEFCLKYMRSGATYKNHFKKCSLKRPPGKLIYRDSVSYGKVKSISVYELHGNEHKLYCQNFCLLAKLFLDHKTLYFYVSPFKFYVLTEDTGKTSRIVGYFSKELGNEEYNLACILILPPYQQKGYGRFLIALSYELSKREEKIGTPERPLSDMGRVCYKSYWNDTVLSLIRDEGNLTLKEISDETGIAFNDVLETLNSFNMVKYWKGQYMLNPNPKVIEEHFRKKEQRAKKAKLRPVKFNPKKLSYKKT